MIKAQTINLLKGVESAGLQPVALLLRKVKRGDLLKINLGKGRHTVLKHDNDVAVKKALLYVLMKHNVSAETYHEIGSLFPSLPRQHKVIAFIDSVAFVLCM